MANPTNQSPTKDQPAEQEADLSLEQLERMILSEDPAFADDLKEVQALPTDANIDLDVVDNGQILPSDDNPWRDAIGIRKFLVIIFPFLPRLWDFQYNFFNNLYLYRTRIQVSLVDIGPRTLNGIKAGAKASVAISKEKIGNFKGLSWPLKLVAIGLVLAVVFTGVFVYRSMTKGVLPGDEEFLIASLEEWSVQSYKYDPETEMDSFYDSPRTIQNIMALPKTIVNLRPSQGSGPNPMLAVEFFLEGLSPEAIIEVKDRETEFRDLFQRTLEELSYGDIDSAEGKQQLTEKLRQVLNTNLTKGKIRRVFIKELVLKP